MRGSNVAAVSCQIQGPRARRKRAAFGSLAASIWSALQGHPLSPLGSIPSFSRRGSSRPAELPCSLWVGTSPFASRITLAPGYNIYAQMVGHLPTGYATTRCHQWLPCIDGMLLGQT